MAFESIYKKDKEILETANKLLNKIFSKQMNKIRSEIFILSFFSKRNKNKIEALEIVYDQLLYSIETINYEFYKNNNKTI